VFERESQLLLQTNLFECCHAVLGVCLFGYKSRTKSYRKLTFVMNVVRDTHI